MQQWKERKNCKQYRVFLKNPSVGGRHAACIDKRPMPRDLDDRVFRFACRIVDLFELLNAKGGAARVVGYQLLDAGTSVGSNYEEAAAGQTKADFIAKLSISRKESRESLFWLRLIAAKRLLELEIIADDISEARQLTAIFTSIIRKARMSPDRG